MPRIAGKRVDTGTKAGLSVKPLLQTSLPQVCASARADAWEPKQADWSIVERGWHAHVLGEAPHTFTDPVEAVKTLRVRHLHGSPSASWDPGLLWTRLRCAVSGLCAQTYEFWLSVAASACVCAASQAIPGQLAVCHCACALVCCSPPQAMSTCIAAVRAGRRRQACERSVAAALCDRG